MTILKNIKITEIDIFKNAKDPKYKSIVSRLTAGGKKLENLIPKNVCYTVSLDIEDFRESLVCLLRATLLDKIEVKTLTIDFSDEKSFYCNDPYVLCDNIQHRIESLFLDQNIGDDIIASLDVTNNSDILISVYTDDLKFTGGWKNTFPRTILAHLHPKKTLRLDNIYVEKGYGMTNARKFSNVHSVGFESLDVKGPNEKGGISALKSKPMKHRLTYGTHRNNTKPLQPFKLALDEISKSLEEIKKVVEENKVEISIFAGSLKYLFNERYHVIAFIVTHILELKKLDIEDCSADYDHHEKPTSYIKIRDPEHRALIIAATEKAIKTIESLKNQLSKN